MPDDNDQTPANSQKFDFSAFPENTLFHERRTGPRRRPFVTPKPEAEVLKPRVVPERRARKERRRRVDPTTYEKQYSPDEMEFMNAVQQFKEQTGRPFPSHGEVLHIAISLGYRKLITGPEDDSPDTPSVEAWLEGEHPSTEA
jgi:hypothetical protein